jgi:branched-chain amino acid transport system substrate-binding protein
LRRATRWFAVFAALSILAACTGEGIPDPPGPASPSFGDVGPLKVAFLQDLSDGEAETAVAPAFQGATLAFANAALQGGLVEVELVSFDTGGDPAGAAKVASEIASDEAFVAALGAPHLDGQAALGDALDAAEVPWLTLSSRGTDLGERGWTAWRRLVADEGEEGAALVEHVDGLRASRDGVCLLGDGTSASRALARAVLANLEADVTFRAAATSAGTEADTAATTEVVASRVAENGCGVVVWTGNAVDAAAVRRGLVETGLRSVGFVGGEGMKRDDYLEEVGPDGEGTEAVCPCVDLSASTALQARRFIQDYQAEFGLPPGPFAVEAWDAARMIVSAVRAGAETRADVAEAVTGRTSLEGLARAYGFTQGGELASGGDAVHLYRDEGGRWIELPGGELQRSHGLDGPP